MTSSDCQRAPGHIPIAPLARGDRLLTGVARSAEMLSGKRQHGPLDKQARYDCQILFPDRDFRIFCKIQTKWDESGVYTDRLSVKYRVDS